MSRLRPIDRFQVATTGLFIMLGAVILVRAGFRGAPWGSYGVGAMFIAYGCYRIGFIMRSLRDGRSLR